MLFIEIFTVSDRHPEQSYIRKLMSFVTPSNIGVSAREPYLITNTVRTCAMPVFRPGRYKYLLEDLTISDTIRRFDPESGQKLVTVVLY